jgi:hypothetical protein
MGSKIDGDAGAALPRTTTFGALGADGLPALKEWLAGRLAGSSSVVEAAQRFAAALQERFASSAVLVRLYGTVPFGSLPDAERRFASGLAAAQGIDQLDPQTPVLVLLGTRGRRPEWNDRTASRGHLAIPLAGAGFVDRIPMLASLLREIGLDLDWLDSPGEALTRRLLGGFNGVFFVPNARVGRDGQGRQVIPAQEFVSAHDVKSVFGMGGAYPWGGFVTAIVFTSEALSRAAAERYAPLVSVFKAASSMLVADRKIFSA